jgi:NhaP-type Na+/H+ or K+/H+ antiporter
LTWRQALVLGYGGLRGAIGLTLALIVNEDHEIPKPARDLMIFHTAGIAFLTLMVNGTTTSFLVKKLGLSRISEVKKKIMKNVLKQFEVNIDHQIDELREKKHF